MQEGDLIGKGGKFEQVENSSKVKKFRKKAGSQWTLYLEWG